MYDDDSDAEDARGGRNALVIACFAVVMLLGVAFGYVFLVPADDSELASYGKVTVGLNPGPPKQLSANTRTSGASEVDTRSDDSDSGRARKTQDGTRDGTGAATGAGAAGTAARSGQTAARTTAQASTTISSQTASGNTSDQAVTQSVRDSGTTEAGASQERDASGSEVSGGSEVSAAANQPPEPPDTRESTQTARKPEPPDTGEAQGAVQSRVTGDTGRSPQWQQYARVLSPPKGVPRIAVVVRGLGLSSAATEAAIKRLPGEVSLSFSPYARRSVEWALRARARGHEVLIDLPMEPRAFPASDPGPKALMTSIPSPKNLDRLDWILGKGRELVGVVGQMGSAFVTNKRAVGPVLRTLKKRGLIFVDNGDVPDNAAQRTARELALPYAVNDRTLDDGQVSRAAINARLVEVERLAQQQGAVVVMAHPYPVTIDLLQAWSRKLDQRNLALVPITNVVQGADRTEAAQLR